MQRTALGAADVPDVNNNAHSASTSGSADAASFGDPSGRAAQAVLERPVERLARNERIVAVGEAVGDEDATRQLESAMAASSWAWCRGSVITNCTSVWAMSRARCSPHRVWFNPATAHAGQPAPHSAKRSRACCRAAHRHAADGPDRGGHGTVRRSALLRPGARRGSRLRSPKRSAGRSAYCASVPFRRSREAAFGAGSGNFGQRWGEGRVVLRRASPQHTERPSRSLRPERPEAAGQDLTWRHGSATPTAK